MCSHSKDPLREFKNIKTFFFHHERQKKNIF
jgi:hypothetical protein